MDKLNIYLIFCFVVCCKDVWCKTLNQDADVQNEFDNDNRIVGGSEATIQAYPYTAYLKLNDGRHNNQCGGTIISEYYIVTAAHCLTGVRSIEVRIGSRNKKSGGNTYNTTTFNSHPFYNTMTFDYDVAVVTVNEGMNLDGYNARAIPMVGPGNDPEEGTNMTITGWGRIKFNGSKTDTLKVAQVPVVDRETCNYQTYDGITDRMFCAGYDDGGIDSCQGDSGGPAVSSDSGRLAGVISFGYGCASPESPGIYARVGEMGIRGYIMAVTGQ